MPSRPNFFSLDHTITLIFVVEILDLIVRAGRALDMIQWDDFGSYLGLWICSILK